MAIKLDAKFLRKHGYGALTKSQADILIKSVHGTAQKMVGLKLAERMTPEQLDSFERFIDASDEAGALAWLQRNLPDYKDVVQDVFQQLGEVLADTARVVRDDSGPSVTGEGSFDDEALT